jgi:hypothetical protein
MGLETIDPGELFLFSACVFYNYFLNCQESVTFFFSENAQKVRDMRARVTCRTISAMTATTNTLEPNFT